MDLKDKVKQSIQDKPDGDGLHYVMISGNSWSAGYRGNDITDFYNERINEFNRDYEEILSKPDIKKVEISFYSVYKKVIK